MTFFLTAQARRLIRRSFFEDNFLSDDEAPRFEDAFEAMLGSAAFKDETPHFKTHWEKAKESYKKKKRNSKFSPAGDNQRLEEMILPF